MDIAGRLREIRVSKNLSQGDIEKRTGLLRCYLSRVENGHAVPAIETLEKICRALEMPIYQLLYDGERVPEIPPCSNNGKDDWASRGKGKRLFAKLRAALGRTSESDRILLLHLASKLSNGERKARG